jgi:methyl-accepting chemotaxis protein
VASNKKVIVLGLDYSEFEGGITKVNRKMELLDEGFKLASEQAKQYGSETDKLAIKQDQLTQKILLQNQKVEDAKKKYNEVMSSQDKYGKKADEADKALLKQRTTLEKLNNELAATKEKMDQVAMSDIDRKMALLQQEFELASEKSKAFATDTEQLTQKSGLLTDKIDLQTQKVEMTKKAYDDASASGQSNEQQLDALYSAYLQNETALEKLNNELHDNDEKVRNSETSTRSFGDTIRDVASSIGIDVNPMVEILAKKFDGISEAAGIAAFSIGTALTTLGKMTLSTAETAGAIDELSHKTGLSTDTIQEFNYAAEYLEISSDDIGSSIAKMTKNMDAARSGTGDAAEAFKKLHVRITDAHGQLRDGEQVFYDTIDALGKVKNETEKDADSMAIFGKSAMNLNNLIIEGSDGIKNYAKQAHEAGYIMDNETIVSFNNMDDAMVEMNKKFDAVKMTLGKALLPVFQTFANVINGIPTPILTAGIVIGGLIAIVVPVATAISGLTTANTLLAISNAAVGATGTSVTMSLAPYLLILVAIAGVIGLILGRSSGIKEAMKDAKDSIADLANSSNKALSGAQNASNQVNVIKKRSEEYGNAYWDVDYSNSSGTKGFASGTDYYPGGYAWVGEAGPELRKFPTGTKIYSNEESKEMLGGDNFYISMNVNTRDIDEIQNLLRTLDSLKQKSRQGRV